MAMLKLDKEKYLRIAREKGANSALTTLHMDMGQLEFQTFEGQEGWQPKSWEHLEEIRSFSRDIWAIALAQENNSNR